MDIRNFLWLGGFLGIIIVFLIFLGILLFVIRLAVWPLRRHRRWRMYTYHDEALELLRMRYAKGEVTKDQYLEMRKDLEER